MSKNGTRLGTITIDRFNPETEEVREESWDVLGSATKFVPATYNSPAEGGIEELTCVERGGEVMSIEDFCSTVLVDDGESHPSIKWILEEVSRQLFEKRY